VKALHSSLLSSTNSCYRFWWR